MGTHVRVETRILQTRAEWSWRLEGGSNRFEELGTPKTPSRTAETRIQLQDSGTIEYLFRPSGLWIGVHPLGTDHEIRNTIPSSTQTNFEPLAYPNVPTPTPFGSS